MKIDPQTTILNIMVMTEENQLKGKPWVSTLYVYDKTIFHQKISNNTGTSKVKTIKVWEPRVCMRLACRLSDHHFQYCCEVWRKSAKAE